jgi:hypothetical protein
MWRRSARHNSGPSHFVHEIQRVGDAGCRHIFHRGMSSDHQLGILGTSFLQGSPFGGERVCPYGDVGEVWIPVFA